MEQSYSGDLAYFETDPKNYVLNICFDDSTIQTYLFFRGTKTYPDVRLIEQWNLMEESQDDKNVNDEVKKTMATVYGTKAQRKYKITTAFTEHRGIYFAITNHLQYIILRNATTKEVISSLKNYLNLLLRL